MIQRFINSIFWLYVVMALPSYELIIDLFDHTRYHAGMMHVSGVISVQFLVLSTSVTPILLLIKRLDYGYPFGRWMLKRRRDFGLASFYYLFLHLVHYIREDGDLVNIYLSAFNFELAVGWLALLIFAILALTSNTVSIRRLGRKWKSLHRLTYIGITATFIHWFLFDFFPTEPLQWLVILCAVKGIHIWLRTKNTRLFETSQKSSSLN